MTFRADAERVGLWEEVQALTSHRGGASGRTPELIKEALRGMRDWLRKERFDVGRKARAAAPKKSLVTRHIPASVKRAVWERDQGS